MRLERGNYITPKRRLQTPLRPIPACTIYHKTVKKVKPTAVTVFVARLTPGAEWSKQPNFIGLYGAVAVGVGPISDGTGRVIDTGSSKA